MHKINKILEILVLIANHQITLHTDYLASTINFSVNWKHKIEVLFCFSSSILPYQGDDKSQKILICQIQRSSLGHQFLATFEHLHPEKTPPMPLKCTKDNLKTTQYSPSTLLNRKDGHMANLRCRFLSWFSLCLSLCLSPHAPFLLPPPLPLLQDEFHLPRAMFHFLPVYCLLNTWFPYRSVFCTYSQDHILPFGNEFQYTWPLQSPPLSSQKNITLSGLSALTHFTY